MLLGMISALSALSAFFICLSADAFDGFSWLWVLPAGFFGVFVALIALWFLLLVIMGALVRMDKPQKKDNGFYRMVIHWTADALITLLRIRLETAGTEKLPKDGRFMLVCNHLAEIDPVVLMTMCRKSQLAFISKRENDQRFLIGPFLHRILCQPINRENDREALKTILKCIDLIRHDKVSISVFPEGYIKPDRKLHHFRSDVFKIAQKTKVPIVVCTLRNTQYVFHNGLRLKPTDVHLHLLDVITPEQYAELSTVELGNMVYEMMAKDLGPENVSNEE